MTFSFLTRRQSTGGHAMTYSYIRMNYIVLVLARMHTFTGKVLVPGTWYR